jgi:Enoyl-CoA hydratase/isomerase
VIRLSKAPYITIGSVRGRTRGAGNELALGLDLRYASLESAYFGQPEVGIGILPGGGGTERLPRLLGRDRALEAIRTSSDYGAAQAERWGWVTRALPDDQLDAFVDDMVAGWPSRTPRPSPRPRPPSIDNLLRAQDTVTAVVSRWIAAAGDPDYRDAFLTILKDPMIGHRDLINIRSRGAQGDATASRTCDVCRYGVCCGFGLPIDLDPTILSTGLAGLNPIRDIANVRTTVLLAEANSTSTTPSGWRAPAPTSPGGIFERDLRRVSPAERAALDLLRIAS